MGSVRDRAIRRSIAAAVLATALLGGIGVPGAEAGTTASISGVAFDDANRNRVRDVGEAAFAGRTVSVFDAATGALVRSAATATDGSWTAGGLAAGTYRVEVSTGDWWALRGDWVPTTTGSVWFRHDAVAVADGASARADFGLRRITWSTTPVSAVTASDGLRVESYTDALSAAQVLAALDAGSLRGGEAATTTVQLGLDGTDYATTSVDGRPGTYTGFRATVRSAYVSYLDRPGALLFHEYGHAWARYHDTVVQQDGTYARYLEARGLTGDSRLGTGHAWAPEELIAEDYRQLFGSLTAAAQPQENREIPPAAQVAGLEEFLRSTFTAPPSTGGGGSGDGGGGGGTDEPAVAAPAISDLSASAGGPPVELRFTLSAPAEVSAVLVDGRGRTVRTLLQQAPLGSGTTRVTWDGVDDRGRLNRDGTFTARLTARNASGSADGSVAFTLGSTSSGGSKGGRR